MKLYRLERPGGCNVRKKYFRGPAIDSHDQQYAKIFGNARINTISNCNVLGFYHKRIPCRFLE
jgi:hypothetical protein